MTYTVRFSPEAIDQLDQLEEYIAQSGSPEVAARYVDGIVAYCEKLDLFPHRGVKREDLTPGLRLFYYRRKVVIAACVDEIAGTVSIVGIFYGGQDYEPRLSADDQEPTDL